MAPRLNPKQQKNVWGVDWDRTQGTDANPLPVDDTADSGSGYTNAPLVAKPPKGSVTRTARGGRQPK